MEFKNTTVSNFQGAFRGLRNPLESWHKSDSEFGIDLSAYCNMDWEVACRYVDTNEKYDYEQEYDKYYDAQEKYADWLDDNGILKDQNECIEYAFIGPKDLDLAHRMIKAGSSDSKFLRQIQVCVDITAPLYWWKEFDTYKVGTVANSTSTMHKLASTPITTNCFELGDFSKDIILYDEQESKTDYNKAFTSTDMMNTIIAYCERLRQLYVETKDKKYWKELIRWLPNGWLQTRTVTLNYTVLRTQYFQRQHHKLVEWHQYCDWIKTLPYAEDLILYEGKN